MKSKIVIMSLVCIFKSSLYAPVPSTDHAPAQVPPASPMFFGGPGMNVFALQFQQAAVIAVQQQQPPIQPPAVQLLQAASQKPEAAD